MLTIDREHQELKFTEPEKVEELVIINCAQPCFEGVNDETGCLDELWPLTNLKNLMLEDRDMTTLPKSVSAMTQLQCLKLECQSLVKITFPPMLEYLAISGIAFVPLGIFELNLKALALWDNELLQLPPSIGRLINLEILDLRGNLLKTLPRELSSLTKLTKLFLGNNRLTSVPPLNRLVSLQSLSLEYNQITRVSKLPANLRYLAVDSDTILPAKQYARCFVRVWSRALNLSFPIESQYSEINKILV